MSEPINYTLLTLPCWESTCDERFQVFTDLSNHHVLHHERQLPLRVAALLEQERAPTQKPALPCTCGCAHAAHAAVTSEAPLQPCLRCACRAFELALVLKEALPALACRYCGGPVPDSAEHRRLELCALDAAHGCLALCDVCGQSWPEHLGPGGRGCGTWIEVPAAPFPGQEGTP